MDIREISVDMELGATHKGKVIAEKRTTCTAEAIVRLVMLGKGISTKPRPDKI